MQELKNKILIEIKFPELRINDKPIGVVLNSLKINQSKYQIEFETFDKEKVIQYLKEFNLISIKSDVGESSLTYCHLKNMKLIEVRNIQGEFKISYFLFKNPEMI